MKRISQKVLDKILRETDAVAIINQYTKLVMRGNRYWGLCPFHKEETPFFTYTPDKKVFYCFRCQEGGSLFSFIMKVENLSFSEAVKFLQDKAK